MPVPVAARHGSAAVRLMGSRVRIPLGAWMSFMNVVFCVGLEVSASGWSLVQRSRTECGVSECDREASITKRCWPTKGCCAMEGVGDLFHGTGVFFCLGITCRFLEDVSFHVHKARQRIFSLSQMNPTHVVFPYSFKIHFHIILRLL